MAGKVVPQAMHDMVRSALDERRAAAGSNRCVCPESSSTWFDRSVCPEPCGSMHTVCNDCGHPLGGCRLGEEPAPMLDLVTAVVEAHAPRFDDDGHVWCDACFDEEKPYEEWAWPCSFYALAAAAVEVTPA